MVTPLSRSPSIPGPVQSALPDWMLESVFWVSIGGLVALVVATAGIWAMVSHLRRIREEGARLVILEELDRKLGRLVADRDDLDLRRLEHILIDLREGQKRLEEAHLRIAEQAASAGQQRAGQALAIPAGDSSVAERVVNRLLSMGFEQIQVITRMEKLNELVHRDGEVLVEAKHGGVLHKGRVSLRDGRLADVSMNPAYSIFP